MHLKKHQAQQLDATLKRLDETLSHWVSTERTFRSLSQLAAELANTLGYDKTLFLAKPNPDKPANHGIHRVVVDKYAKKLIPGKSKISYEALERQLNETKLQLSMIEDAYKAGLRRTKKLQPETETASSKVNFFYEFEQTCLLLQRLLRHPNTGLEIIEGKLYDTAPIFGDIVLICEAERCKPFLDWQSGKAIVAGKLLSTDSPE